MDTHFLLARTLGLLQLEGCSGFEGREAEGGRAFFALLIGMINREREFKRNM